MTLPLFSSITSNIYTSRTNHATLCVVEIKCDCVVYDIWGYSLSVTKELSSTSIRARQPQCNECNNVRRKYLVSRILELLTSLQLRYNQHFICVHERGLELNNKCLQYSLAVWYLPAEVIEITAFKYKQWLKSMMFWNQDIYFSIAHLLLIQQLSYLPIRQSY